MEVPSKSLSLAARRPARSAWESAFEAALPAMLALGEDELLHVNINISKLYTRVRGVLPKLEQLKSDLHQLPAFDVSWLEALDTYTGALGHAHAVCLASHQPPNLLPELEHAATEWRRILLADSRALIARGRLPARSLDKLTRRKGYKNVAFDLAALCALLRRHFGAIAGKTAITLDEIEQASAIAEELLTTVGLRENGRSIRPEASDLRRRAFTLLVTAYEQIRRAVLYLRANHGDAQEWMPSLYTKRRSKLNGRPQTSAITLVPSGNQGTSPRPAPRGRKTSALSRFTATRNRVGREEDKWRAVRFALRPSPAKDPTQGRSSLATHHLTNNNEDRTMTDLNDTNPGTEIADAVSNALEAYQELLPKIRSVPKEDLVRINLDVPTAVTTTLGSLPELLAMRKDVEHYLPEFDSTAFDKLRPSVLALAYAHAAHISATTSAGELKEKADAAVATREMLLADARALATRGLIDPAALKNLKGPVGYRNVAFDVMALTSLLRKSWSEVGGKTAVSKEELGAAETLAEEVLTTQGLKDEGPAVVDEAAEVRQQAFSLFARTYDQIRRAIHYLRWEQGDAEDIAPSLYAASRRRSSSSSKPEASAPGSDVAQANTDVPVPAASQQDPAPAPAAAVPGGTPLAN